MGKLSKKKVKNNVDQFRTPFDFDRLVAELSSYKNLNVLVCSAAKDIQTLNPFKYTTDLVLIPMTTSNMNAFLGLLTRIERETQNKIWHRANIVIKTQQTLVIPDTSIYPTPAHLVEVILDTVSNL